MREYLGPTNCYFDGDPNQKTEMRMWFECPKCNEKIWKHLYNEHVHHCIGVRMPAVEPQKEEQPINVVPKRRNWRQQTTPLKFNSTKSRHRRR